MKNWILVLVFGIVSLSSVQAEGDKSLFAGTSLPIGRPEWLLPVTKEAHAKRFPGRRYPGNYHESKDGKLTFYSELDRDSEGKTIEAIHQSNIRFQQESFSDILTWNRKDLVTIGGKPFSLLDFNIKDPDGEKELTFRMIVLDTLVNGKISHTIVTVYDQNAEKAYVGNLYKWLQQEKR